MIDVEEDMSSIWGAQKALEWGIVRPDELENGVGETDECWVSLDFILAWLATGGVDERKHTQCNLETH
ncbi:hypothetical protein FIBSPDRAFT_846760 [Athelia psychrophila]|uniref:Uncharacterized protein n=1 Tax=Athelia psychrophila TaxID=1759441 RepID=A0A166XCP0_9AGAM|nr:hypothetical protein FIBSPDRAFT_846760 [Fibularhizoctonia sp. CBS 109695]